MAAVVIQELTQDYIDNCKPLLHLKNNAERHLPEDFDDEQIVLFLESIVKKAVNDAAERTIDTSWENNNFIKLVYGIYRTCMINLCKKNSFILNELQNNKLKYSHIALINDFEKDPAVWAAVKEEVSKKENENISNVNLVTNIKCGKCYKNEILMMRFSTRSADEAETLFYKCVNCSHKWRSS